MKTLPQHPESSRKAGYSRGLSLVETIYATLLLGFITLFLINLYPSSFIALKRGDSSLAADNFANNILEDLHSRSFANLLPGNEPAYQPLSVAGINYQPSLALSYLPDASEKAVKVAKVTVRWNYGSHDYQVVHNAYLHNVTR